MKTLSHRAQRKLAAGSGQVKKGAAIINGGLRFAQWMQVAYQALQSLLQYVGVNLRGRNIGMPEQGLHRAQVGAVLQQVTRKGVTQHVRADPLRLQAGRRGEHLEVARKMLARQVPACAE